MYNEEDEKIINFIEYKRLLVQGRLYALLQPEDDLDLLVPFRIEDKDVGEDEEVYIYIVDDDELDAVEEAWQKLHS